MEEKDKTDRGKSLTFAELVKVILNAKLFTLKTSTWPKKISLQCYVIAIFVEVVFELVEGTV